MELDVFYIETAERYYNLYKRAWENMIAISKDKQYTRMKFFDLFFDRKNSFYENSFRKDLIEEIDHHFKLGKPLSIIIKLVRRKWNRKNDVHKNQGLEYHSDIAIVRMFLEYKTNVECYLRIEERDEVWLPFNGGREIYSSYYSTQVNQPELNIQIDESVVDEIIEKSKEFTTARQTLAMYFLFSYMQVNNVDKSGIARFIEFLTSKNYDNIYKKVREPFKEKNKSLKKDLLYIREYFINVEMFAVVKMVDNEIAECERQMRDEMKR